MNRALLFLVVFVLVGFVFIAGFTTVGGGGGGGISST